MKMKKTWMFAFAVLFLISGIVFVSAITGSIGNAKMVLYPEVNGWTNTVIEKTILVNNVNNVPVNITLKTDENASKFIELIDESFILEPGESTKAQIEIKVKKEGRYEGRVNVYFKPVEGKDSGVVLSSTIVVIAKKQSDYEEETPAENENNAENNTEGTGEVISGNENAVSDKNKILRSWGVSTFILLIILLVMLLVWSKKRKRNNKRKRKSK
jgi:ABC-type Na+ efflux pump permease subunit